MMTGKDYYQILGVAETASPNEIKRVYRELAKRYHPDANPGDYEAEQRFKDISEAYDVLKDPEKRRKYDQLKKVPLFSYRDDLFSFNPQHFRRQARGWAGGSDQFESQHGFSFGDVLKEIFGFEHEGHDRSAFEADRSNTKTPKTPQIDVELDFMDAVRGTTKMLRVSVNRPCAHCNGTGYRNEIVCAHCLGSGKPRDFRKVKVHIPAGIEDGQKLRLSGVPVGLNGHKRAADVIVNIRIAPHKFFSRKGLDIYSEVALDEKLLTRGTKLRVKTVYGKKVEVRVPAGTKKGTLIRLRSMGIVKSDARGDYFIKLI